MVWDYFNFSLILSHFFVHIDTFDWLGLDPVKTPWLIKP